MRIKLLKDKLLNFIYIYIYIYIYVIFDTATRMFQYKILNNILYLNKLLFKFKKVSTSSCSFCKLVKETNLNIF